jgi:hypothetical protein
VTTPFSTSGPEFRAIAKAAVSADTLDQFLRDVRSRYPDTAAAPPPAPAAPPAAEPQTRSPERSTSGSSASGKRQKTAAR